MMNHPGRRIVDMSNVMRWLRRAVQWRPFAKLDAAIRRELIEEMEMQYRAIASRTEEKR